MAPAMQALDRIDAWYRQNEIAGFAEASGEVVARAANTGAVVIPVRETRVGDVRFRFVDKDGNEVPVRPSSLCHCLYSGVGVVCVGA